MRMLPGPSDTYTPHNYANTQTVTVQAGSSSCTGMDIEWKPGSPMETYPTDQHVLRTLKCIIVGFGPGENRIRIRSEKCEGHGSKDYPTCYECAQVPELFHYQRFVESASISERPEHTPLKYLNGRHLINLIKRYRIKNRVLRNSVSESQQEFE